MCGLTATKHIGVHQGLYVIPDPGIPISQFQGP